ncbi:SAG family member [Eimeria mitis]|uniref:SAG family member n=1 Tax=Eimeria mitis TaxID=44415 RepID=U6K7P5_9EIME|nr:SAG family member [Eimeria mitis]CDJ34030.1 SAG family member [Eimeria mitis]
MAPLYKTAAAVCLVTLCGLQTEASTPKHKFTVEHVEADAYLAANLARNGKLPVHISEVTKEESLVSALEAKVSGDEPPTAEDCTALITDKLKEDFHHSFVYDTEAKASPDYRQLLQNALDEGLAVFKNKAYPQTNDEWQSIWKQDAGANLAYLLGSNSTTIGCVIGRCTQVTTSDNPVELQVGDGGSGTQQETLTKDAVLFCQLKPAAEKNSAPFDEEYFNGLIERTTELKDMTEDDLKNSVGNGPAATASTILIAGLVAMLTAVSA